MATLVANGVQWVKIGEKLEIPGIPAFIRVNYTLRFSANVMYHQLSYNQLIFTKSLKLFLP